MDQDKLTFQERLHREATRVREYLESKGTSLNQLLRDFPCGACGNASDMLGAWLKELGIDGIEYVYGERGDHSHGWLEILGIVIDITSDQFADGLGKVYVGPPTAFHATFGDQRRSIPEVSPFLYDVYSNMIGSF